MKNQLFFCDFLVNKRDKKMFTNEFVIGDFSKIN